MKKIILQAIDGGWLLFLAAIAAMVCANLPILHDNYVAIISYRIIGFGLAEIINDFFMAIFFLMIGIETKEELISGHLSTPSQRLLPLVTASAGVVLPMLIYYALNFDKCLRGIAIPAATDIAFTLGALSLMTKYIPKSLRVFAMILAVVDDIIAICIIAIFYTNNLAFDYLIWSVLLIFAMIVLNLRGITKAWPYLIFGIILWYTIHCSGIHSTIAGVILGLIMPQNKCAMPKKIKKAITPPIQYIILPLFALFNGGVTLSNVSQDMIFAPITIGISLGLCLGKLVGIWGSFYLLIKSKLVKMPEGANLYKIGVTSAFCGIGFTMSIFVAMLAYPQIGSLYSIQAKTGIIAGSIFAMIIGVTMASCDMLIFSRYKKRKIFDKNINI